MADEPEDDSGTEDPAFGSQPTKTVVSYAKYIIDGDTTIELPLSVVTEDVCRSDVRHAAKEASSLFATAIARTPLTDGICPCEEPRSKNSGTIEAE